MFAVDRKGTATILDSVDDWNTYFAKRAYRAKLKKRVRVLVGAAVGAGVAYTAITKHNNSDTEND